MPSPIKTILFFPLNSPGHVNSSLGIADKLKADYGLRTVFLLVGPGIGNTIEEHGHELVIVEEKNPLEDYEITADDDEVDETKRVKKTFLGARKWPHYTTKFAKTLARDPVDALVETMETFEGVMITEVKENLEACEQAIDSIKPDMIVVDAYIIPPYIVRRTDIPWVRLYSACPIHLVKSKLPGGVKPPAMCGFKIMTKEKRQQMINNQPEEWQAIVYSWRVALERVGEAAASVGGELAKLMAKYGVEPPKGDLAHESPHINLYMYPKELDYDVDDDIFEYAPRWLRCDSLMRAADLKPNEFEVWSARLNKAMVGKTEMIFFSLGSIASGNLKLMKRYMDILKQDQKRLYVVSKGVNGDKFELDPGNMIGGDFIPQTFFLERANLAIVHGGNNSVTECMYYGVPLIVLPLFSDQYDNAQRIEDLDLGKRLDVHKCTASELMSAVDELLSNQELGARVKAIGKYMRERDESRKISFVLKKLLDDGQLEQSFIDDCRLKSFKEIKG